MIRPIPPVSIMQSTSSAWTDGEYVAQVVEWLLDNGFDCDTLDRAALIWTNWIECIDFFADQVRAGRTLH